MDRLLQSIFELVKDKHPSKVSELAKKVQKAGDDGREFSLGEADARAFSKILEHGKRLNCSTDQLTGMINGVSSGLLRQKESESIELVWTGPDTNFIPVRRSAQVLKALIDGARESIFIVSYVSFKLPEIDRAIKKAIARGVEVNLLLETIDKQPGDTFSRTVQKYLQNFPGINLYEWPKGKRPAVGARVASVHAKCAVADSEVAFITSANLTGAAMDKNIEVGLLINGGDIPRSTSAQLASLITQKVIVKI